MKFQFNNFVEFYAGIGHLQHPSRTVYTPEQAIGLYTRDEGWVKVPVEDFFRAIWVSAAELSKTRKCDFKNAFVYDKQVTGTGIPWRRVFFVPVHSKVSKGCLIFVTKPSRLSMGRLFAIRKHNTYKQFEVKFSENVEYAAVAKTFPQNPWGNPWRP